MKLVQDCNCLKLQLNEARSSNITSKKGEDLTMQHRDQSNHQKYYETVAKKTITELRNIQSRYNRLMEVITKPRFGTNCNLSRRILGESVATHPATSFSAQSDIICFARAQILSEAGLLDVDLAEKIVESSPSEDVMRRLLNEVSTDVMFLMHKRLFYDNKKNDGQYPSVFISADKGTDGSFVKVLSWFDKKSEKVEQQILDVVTKGTSA